MLSWLDSLVSTPLLRLCFFCENPSLSPDSHRCQQILLSKSTCYTFKKYPSPPHAYLTWFTLDWDKRTTIFFDPIHSPSGSTPTQIHLPKGKSYSPSIQPLQSNAEYFQTLTFIQAYHRLLVTSAPSLYTAITIVVTRGSKLSCHTSCSHHRYQYGSTIVTSSTATFHGPVFSIRETISFSLVFRARDISHPFPRSLLGPFTFSVATPPLFVP